MSTARQVRQPIDLDALVAAVDPEAIEEGSIRFAEIIELIEGARLLREVSRDAHRDGGYLLEIATRIAESENDRLSSFAGKLRRIVDPPLIDDKEWTRIRRKAERDNARALAATAKLKMK